MVSKRASLVLNLSDAFTKRPITGLSSVSVTLNGELYKPVYKDGGWFVFVNLPVGEHDVTVSSSLYQTEKISISLKKEAGGYIEEYRRMKPSGALTKKGAKSCRLQVVYAGKPYANALLLLMGEKDALKVAEDDVIEGRDTMKLFVASSQAALRLIPGRFFIRDASRSEVIAIRERYEGDIYVLGGSVTYPHKRGAALSAVEEYWTDENGMAFLVVPENMELEFLCAPKKVYKQYTPIKGEGDFYMLDLGQ